MASRTHYAWSDPTDGPILPRSWEAMHWTVGRVSLFNRHDPQGHHHVVWRCPNHMLVPSQSHHVGGLDRLRRLLGSSTDARSIQSALT